MTDIEGVETGRITIRRILTGADGETSDITSTDVEGDATHALTALGMLALAHDAILHSPDDEWEDDE